MSLCPTTEQLRLLLAEQLTDDERESMEAHIEGCALCQQLLVELTRAPDLEKDSTGEDAQPWSYHESVSTVLHRLRQRPANAADSHRASTEETLQTLGQDLAVAEHWPQVPGYEILGVLGRGGMGIVHKARHLALNRPVALKMIQTGYQGQDAMLARFRTEAEAIARLQHPHVVQIFEVGEHDGLPYLALELVEGGSLSQRLDGTPLPARQAAQLVETLAGAVHAAHQRGLIHRDLKPANVLLTSDGTPKVSDFGLAKLLDSGSGQTASGEVLGTPSYMSPEQAESKGSDVGPTTDVYALGAILYELLTGRPPFRAVTALETLMQVVHQEPVPPRQLQSSTPRDLETVCLKCLHKEPRKRYSSAEALAEDLQRYLAGTPIQARPIGTLERGIKWARRKPTQAALLAVSVLAPLTLATIVLAYNAQLRQALEAKGAALRQAEQQSAIATAVNDFLQKDLLGQADIGQQTVGQGGERDPEVKVRTLLDRASQSIEGKFPEQPLTEAAIRLTMGNAYRELGSYPDSQRHLERSLQLRTDHLGTDHVDTLVSKHDLAELYQTQGKYDRAEPLYQEVLQIRTVKLGADHLDTLTSKDNLAVLYWTQSKYDLAEPLFKEVLQGRTAQLGADHLDTLTSKHNLGMLYLDQGKYALAEPLHQEVLQGLTAQLGADHPHTLICKNCLAELYKEQGKDELAEPLYKEAVQGQTAKLGAEHPDTLISKNNLALLYHAKGKYDLAEPLFKEVLKARMAKLGADHPHTLTCKQNLARLYNAQGKYDLAEPLYKEVLHAQTAKLGSDHRYTLVSKQNLATLYRDQGKYDRAEPLFKEALQALTSKLGSDHPYTIMTVANLGINYRESGQTKEAIPLLVEALERARKRPEGFNQLAKITSDLALTYDQAELFDQAEPLYRTALDDTRKQRGADHPEFATQLALLSRNLLRQKKYADAEPILRDCLAIQIKKQPDQWTTFGTRSMLGEALTGQKKYAEAEPLLLQGYEGMKEREKNIPPQSKVRLVEGLERLVQLYDAWGKNDKADDYRHKLAGEQSRSPRQKK
jgi:serine/threonine protein kinase/lipopolysaccharide biosynthesis regulator YciM